MFSSFARSISWASIIVVLGPMGLFGANLPETATTPIKIKGSFVSSTSDIMHFTFYGETTTTWQSLSGTSIETDARLEKIKPGKEYEITISGLDPADTYNLAVSARPEFTVYLSNAEGVDLISRRKVTAVNPNGSTDTFRLRIERRNETTQEGFSVAGSWAVDRPIWKVGMGILKNGGSAGSIQIRADGISSLNFDPSDLIYEAPSDEVGVILDGTRLRQVYAPQGIADILYTLGTTYYDIYFYSWKDVTGWNGTTYSIRQGATAVVRYTISKYTSGAYSTGVDIKRTVGSVYWKTRLILYLTTWYLYDWTKNAADPSTSCLRKAITTVDFNYTEDRLTTEYGRSSPSSSFWPSSSTLRKYPFDNLWGTELESVTRGYGGAHPVETAYQYFNLSSDPEGSYFNLAKETRSDGGYTEYEYYDDFDRLGLVKKIHEPFQDVQKGRRTEFSYESDGSGERFLPVSVNVFVNNTEVARTQHEYSTLTVGGEPVRKTITKSYSDLVNFRTDVMFTYREDASDPFLRGLPYAVKKADGTQTSWVYPEDWLYVNYEGTYMWRYYRTRSAIDGAAYYAADGTTVLPSPAGYSAAVLSSFEGQPVEPLYLVARQSTSQATMVDVSGLPVGEKTEICDSGTTLSPSSGKSFNYDLGARMTQVVRYSYAGTVPASSSQSIFDVQYLDGELTRTTDEMGSVVEYAYDAQGRVASITHKGMTATTSPYATPAVPETTEQLSYDGSNRIVLGDTWPAGLGEFIGTASDYDTAGRLIMQQTDTDDTVSFEYPSSSQVKIINEDGGTITEFYYLDGSLHCRTGDAANELFVVSRADSGGLTTQTALTDFTVVGDIRDGWKITKRDWLGRIRTEEEPIFQSSSKRYTTYTYNSKGQRTQRSVGTAEGGAPLLAPYRYVYDSLGRLEKDGLDLDNSGGLVDLSTSDRMRKQSVEYWKDTSNFWWHVVKAYAYPVSGSGPVYTGETRIRLAPGAGELERSVKVDLNGNTETSWTEVDRNTAVVAAKASFDPYPTGDSLVLSRCGYLVHRQDTAGVKVTFDYDSLGRLVLQKGRTRWRPATPMPSIPARLRR